MGCHRRDLQSRKTEGSINLTQTKDRNSVRREGGQVQRSGGDFWPALVGLNAAGLAVPGSASTTLKVHWVQEPRWYATLSIEIRRVKGARGNTALVQVLAEAGHRPVNGALAVPADHGVAPLVAAILEEGGPLGSAFELIEA